MNHPVRIFEIGKDARPDEKPRLVSDFAVTTDTLEEALRAVRARLASEGRPIRSLSFVDGGGLVAVVHPKEEITVRVRAPGPRSK